MKLKKTGRGSICLLIALIAGLLLVLWSGETEGEAADTEAFEGYEKRCEEKLSAILCEMDGVERAQVMVTLDELPGGKVRPKVRGVAVVIHGNEGDTLRYQVVMLISASLGVSSEKIFVSFS